METMLITDPKQISAIVNNLRGTYAAFDVAMHKDEVLSKKPIPQILR